MAVLSTKRLVESLDRTLIQQSQALCDLGVKPGLSAILVEGDPSSVAYYHAKRRLADKLGIAFHGTKLPADAPTDDVLQALHRHAGDPCIHGVFLEMPLPPHIDITAIRNAIPLAKDVDCVSEAAFGRLLVRSSHISTGDLRSMSPATPLAVMELLRSAEIPVAGAHAVVVGRSLTVGRPLALLLLAENATVTVCHSHTTDLTAHTRHADILCVAAGRPHLIGRQHIRPGAVVIDIGIHATSDGLVGDVDTQAVADLAAWVTPVPGGVGALTTRMIFANLLQSAQLATRCVPSTDSTLDPHKERPSS